MCSQKVSSARRSHVTEQRERTGEEAQERGGYRRQLRAGAEHLGNYGKYPRLAEAGLKKGRGKWQIEFNYKVMPYLMGLTSQFTTYSLYDCGKINSVRVIRLYESLCQYRSSGVWITTQDWLSERFMLPESQRSNFAEMIRTFINPALKKINANTPLKAAMTQNNDGRLVFTILDSKS